MSPASRDRALRNILASNALTAAVALLFDWSLLAVLWPFWIQSVVIGVFARRLRVFTSGGIRPKKLHVSLFGAQVAQGVSHQFVRHVSIGIDDEAVVTQATTFGGTTQ